MLSCLITFLYIGEGRINGISYDFPNIVHLIRVFQPVRLDEAC